MSLQRRKLDLIQLWHLRCNARTRQAQQHRENTFQVRRALKGPLMLSPKRQRELPGGAFSGDCNGKRRRLLTQVGNVGSYISLKASVRVATLAVHAERQQENIFSM